jgi:hypothetical protein
LSRRYIARPGQLATQRPEQSANGVDLHGLGPRHWDLVALIAAYAVLDTNDVAELMFGSRPAAARHLTVLVRAGLVWRFVHSTDPSHRAHYEVSTDGVRLLAERLHQAGQPVPIKLAGAHADQYLVNDLLIGLNRTAQASQGRYWLYGWRRGVDVAAWLHGRGVSGVQPRAAGVWLQDGRAVRFLLHVDDDTPAPLSSTPAPHPARALDGYRHSRAGVPASCILVLLPTRSRESDLHNKLLNAPLPVPVATATFDRFEMAEDASAPIWTPTGDATQLVRLIDTAETDRYPADRTDP